MWEPKHGSLKSAGSGRKAPLCCNADYSMLQCSFMFVAAQLLVKLTPALQKGKCCSATSAAQLSENCSASSVFACGMLQGWGLGLADVNEMCCSHQRKLTSESCSRGLPQVNR